METAGGAPLHYDFSPLANVSGFHSSPRFTNKGLRYFHSFNLGLCGKEVRSCDPGEVCEKMSLTRVKNLLRLSYRAECWPPVWTMSQRVGEKSEVTSVSPPWSPQTSGARAWCPPSLSSLVTHSSVRNSGCSCVLLEIRGYNLQDIKHHIIIKVNIHWCCVTHPLCFM